MKIVFIIQNHHTAFGMDISKIYNKEKHKLYLIVNKVGHELLKSRSQEVLFQKVFVSEDFSLEYLKNLIDTVMESETSIDGKLELNIVTNADQAVSVCGKLRKYFKLENEDFERYNNKLVMKEVLKDSTIKLPKHISFNKNIYSNSPEKYIDFVCQTITFPLFAKPIDQAGSFGTEKILSKPELIKWAIGASQQKYQFEIDEYIEGTLYHCDSFIKNGKIMFTQVCENIFPCYEFICGKPQGTIPLLPESQINIELCKYTQEVINQLGIIKAGVTHLEIFRKLDGELIFLEIAPRSAGALIPSMYKKYLGIGLPETHVNLQIKDDYELNINYGPYTAWMSFPRLEGRVTQLNIPKLNSEHEIKWKIEVDQTLSNPQRLADEACGILFWNKDYNNLLEDFNYFRTFVPYVVDKNVTYENIVTVVNTL